MAYLDDLGNGELMMRSHPECNHLNWQVGHLIAAKNQMMSQIADSIPPVPDGFADKYAKETAANNDASAFASKEELMAAYKTQREGTMAVLEQMTAEELDQETGVDFAPTKGALLMMQGALADALRPLGRRSSYDRQARKDLAQVAVGFSRIPFFQRRAIRDRNSENPTTDSGILANPTIVGFQRIPSCSQPSWISRWLSSTSGA